MTYCLGLVLLSVFWWNLITTLWIQFKNTYIFCNFIKVKFSRFAQNVQQFAQNFQQFAQIFNNPTFKVMMLINWFYQVNLSTMYWNTYKVLYSEVLESTSLVISFPKVELLPVALFKHTQFIRYHVEGNGHWLKQVNQESFIVT